MGIRLDLTGKEFGCLVALSIAPSRKTPSGATVGYWLVRCNCGKCKEMGVAGLTSRNHFSCGKGCTLRSDAKVSVKCDRCGLEYQVRNDSIPKGLKKAQNPSHVCRKCRAAAASAKMAGKPSHNRLADGEAAFNSLFGAYKRNAVVQRNVPFELGRDAFKEITQKNCHYCGMSPSTVRTGDAVRSKGKTSGVYLYNGIDRVDSSLGYVRGNVVPCCEQCNRMKGAMLVAEFLKHVARISQHQETTRAPKSGNRAFYP